MHVLFAIGDALWMAFAMLWQLFWGLSPGFLFSAAVEVMVTRGEMVRLLPDLLGRQRAASGRAVTAVLNIAFGTLFVVLAFVFFRTGAPDMLRMISGKRSSAPSRGHDMPASNPRRHQR